MDLTLNHYQITMQFAPKWTCAQFKKEIHKKLKQSKNIKMEPSYYSELGTIHQNNLFTMYDKDPLMHCIEPNQIIFLYHPSISNNFDNLSIPVIEPEHKSEQKSEHKLDTSE